MKKIIVILIIILLAIISYFSYKRFKKINSPKYSYIISDSIDIYYYDQKMVTQYFENVQELEAYVRRVWYNHEIDVTHVNELDQTSIKFGKYFSKLNAQTIYLEKLLKQSFLLKSNGFTNKEIKKVEIEGLQETEWEFIRLLESQFGDESPYIWSIQKKLIEKGYKIPLDGVFKRETLEAIKDFKEKNNLSLSDTLDRPTLLKIYEPL